MYLEIIKLFLMFWRLSKIVKIYMLAVTIDE